MTSLPAFILVFPVLIAQWVGVIALRRPGAPGSWWCMLTGTICSSLGVVALIFATIGMSGFAPYIMLGGLSSLGSFLFAIGFALHGLRSARAASRLADLEQLSAAMSEEIARLQAEKSSK